MSVSHPPNNHPNLVHLLHRASQFADALFERQARNASLTARQLVVLDAIAALDDPSQTDICKYCGIDRSTLADIVRRLVERGLLVRKRTKQDARMYAVRLSASGRHMVDAAVPGAIETNDTLLAALPVSQRSSFVSSLQKIVEAMGPISSARVASKSRARAAAFKAQAQSRGGR